MYKCQFFNVVILSLFLIGCNSDVFVETELGTIIGKATQKHHLFYGVPYAQPPIGKGRWQPPKPIVRWVGALNAKAYKPSCPQDSVITPVINTSEDCLNLNITRPAKETGNLRPVVVWLHGGSFIVGSNNESKWNPDIFSLFADAVVVAPNYRLGFFGDLVVPELANEEGYLSPNFFLLDQLMALQWVQNNIESFGGDPNNVTLMGESAGAASTCWHLSSPLSKGLFHKAIIQSGSCAWDVSDMKEAFAKGDDFANLLGCEGEERLDCLRSKSHRQIVEAHSNRYGALNPLVGKVPLRAPVLDDYFFLEDPNGALRKGQQSDVPVIIGVNKNEGSLWAYLDPILNSEVTYLGRLSQLYGNDAFFVEEQYPEDSFSSSASAIAEIKGDMNFVCPAVKSSESLAKGGNKVFFYYFTKTPEGIVHSLLSMLGNVIGLVPGSYHASEIPYVFGTESMLGVLQGNSVELSHNMMSYWKYFIHTGNPNHNEEMNSDMYIADTTLPYWPNYTKERPNYLEMNSYLKLGSHLKYEECHFWNEVM